MCLNAATNLFVSVSQLNRIIFPFSHQPLFVRTLWLIHFLVFKVVVYLFLDAIDRALVLPLVYRNYGGIAVDEADQIAKLAFERYMKPRIRDEARREVRE